MLPTLEQRVLLQQRPKQMAVMHQRWEDLWFLHWEMEAEILQKTLPPGLFIDEHEGRAYVAIVPFKMRAIRPRGVPAIPYLSNFLECNVRTYVHDSNGVPGVWFYSLDTDRWIAYWVAKRFFCLPYVWSAMRYQSIKTTLRYQVRRQQELKPCEFVLEPHGDTRVATAGSLEFFFLERYLLYSYNSRKKQLFRGRVYHQPYEITNTINHAWDAKPLAWNRLPISTGPPMHSCFSKRVSVEVFPLERVSCSGSQA
jgi:uncharacterized protein YqjF (DUF2071 family)